MKWRVLITLIRTGTSTGPAALKNLIFIRRSRKSVRGEGDGRGCGGSDKVKVCHQRISQSAVHGESVPELVRIPIATCDVPWGGVWSPRLTTPRYAYDIIGIKHVFMQSGPTGESMDQANINLLKKMFDRYYCISTKK